MKKKRVLNCELLCVILLRVILSRKVSVKTNCITQVIVIVYSSPQTCLPEEEL